MKIVKKSIRLTNSFKGEQAARYELRSEDLLAADQVARQQGFQLIGIYHSHPDCDAYFSETDLKEVGIDNSVSKQVGVLANLAKKTGLNGVVCGSNEIKLVKDIGGGLEIFVPGIRLKKNDDEQKRTTSPQQAINSGADFLVIGRPITIGEPLKNIKEIINSLN